jgi:hypothetical protein
MASFLRNREDFSLDCRIGDGQLAHDTAAPGTGCEGVLQDHARLS